MLLSFRNKKIQVSLLVGVLMVAIIGSTQAQTGTIVNIILSDIRFQTLYYLLANAGLLTFLEGDGPFTLFAPTTQAFLVARVNTTRLLQPTWSRHLEDLMLFHVALFEIWANDLAVGDVISTAKGLPEFLEVTAAPDPVVLNNNSTLIDTDLIGTNGVVQVIDFPLLPISASQSIYVYALNNPEFSILADLIQQAGLIDALNGPGPRTIFAPDNDAFNAVPNDDYNALIADPQAIRNLLLYHLVDGNIYVQELRLTDGVVSVQGSDIDVTSIETGTAEDVEVFLNDDSTITSADFLVENGVFHTIDRVLIPPVEEDPTIADLLPEQGLKTFMDAAATTGLLDVLNNPSEWLTAFASVDAGFDPEFTTIYSDPQYHLHLRDAMNYQVVKDLALWTGELFPNLEMPTLLAGENTTVTQGHPTYPIIINFDSQIITPDIIASNGALQVVDKVIVPPFMKRNVVDVLARQPSQFSTLVYLLVLTGLIPDLSGAGPFTIFAPTNAAFDELLWNNGAFGGDGWQTNLNMIKDVLKYHVVPQVVYEQDLTVNATIGPTLQGEFIKVSDPSCCEISNSFWRKGGDGRRNLVSELHGRKLPIHEIPEYTEPGVFLNSWAEVIETDWFANNGVVHAIDRVLIPPWPETYVPPTNPPNNDICIQWGQFDSLCCPSTPDVNRQPEWYCEYITGTTLN